MKKITVGFLSVFVMALIILSPLRARAQEVASSTPATVQTVQELRAQLTSLIQQLIAMLWDQVNAIKAQQAAQLAAKAVQEARLEAQQQLIANQGNQIEAQGQQIAALTPAPAQPAPLPPPPAPGAVDPEAYPQVRLFFAGIETTEGAALAMNRDGYLFEWIATQRDRNPMECVASGDFAGKVGTQGSAMRVYIVGGVTQRYTVSCTDKVTGAVGSKTLNIAVE